MLKASYARRNHCAHPRNCASVLRTTRCSTRARPSISTRSPTGSTPCFFLSRAAPAARGSSSTTRRSPMSVLKPLGGVVSALQRIVDACLIATALYGANHTLGHEWDQLDMIASAVAVAVFLAGAELRKLYES